jgi:hypothetical protein
MVDLRRDVEHQPGSNAAGDPTFPVETAAIAWVLHVNGSVGVAHPMPRPPPPTGR